MLSFSFVFFRFLLLSRFRLFAIISRILPFSRFSLLFLPKAEEKGGGGFLPFSPLFTISA